MYLRCCREANRLINDSCKQYFSNRISNLPQDPRKRWAAVKVFLRTAERDNSRTEEENNKACTAISAFFAEKIQKIREFLKSELAGISINHFSFDAPHCGQSLTALSMVTLAEVFKLITSCRLSRHQQTL